MTETTPKSPTARQLRTQERREKVRALLDNGKTVDEVAEAMGVTRPALVLFMHRNGIADPNGRAPGRPSPVETPEITDGLTREIEDLARRGAHVNLIAQRVGITAYRVEKILAAAGIEPPPQNALWDRMDTIREMAAAGQSCSEIAEHLDVSQTAVLRVAQRFGIEIQRRYRTRSAESAGRYQQVLEMQKNGMSVAEIAAQLGCTRANVYAILKPKSSD